MKKIHRPSDRQSDRDREMSRQTETERPRDRDREPETERQLWTDRYRQRDGGAFLPSRRGAHVSLPSPARTARPSSDEPLEKRERGTVSQR